jgi:hypothetical protein
MKQFCVACHGELEPVAEFINVHSGCLQSGEGWLSFLSEGYKSRFSESIKGYSQKVTKDQVSNCEVCQESAADLSVYLCLDCFLDAKVYFRNSISARKSISDLLDSAKSEAKREDTAHESFLRETERLKQRELETERLKQRELDRFNRLASSVPENVIRVCKSCGLPIRQWDSRCGCS